MLTEKFALQEQFILFFAVRIRDSFAILVGDPTACRILLNKDFFRILLQRLQTAAAEFWLFAFLQNLVPFFQPGNSGSRLKAIMSWQIGIIISQLVSVFDKVQRRVGVQLIKASDLAIRKLRSFQPRDCARNRFQKSLLTSHFGQIQQCLDCVLGLTTSNRWRFKFSSPDWLQLMIVLLSPRRLRFRKLSQNQKVAELQHGLTIAFVTVNFVSQLKCFCDSAS